MENAILILPELVKNEPIKALNSLRKESIFLSL